MLHDVAAGMSYLHGRSHIHGDLRSPNLFVGADGTVSRGSYAGPITILKCTGRHHLQCNLHTRNSLQQPLQERYAAYARQCHLIICRTEDPRNNG